MSTRRPVMVMLSVLIGGCGYRERNVTHDQAQRAVLQAPAATIPAFSVSGFAAARAPERGAPSGFREPSRADVAATDSSADTPRLVALSGQASLLVDSVPQAAERLAQLTVGLGGYVAGSSLDAGAGSEHTARLEIKVPAGRFEQLLSGLRRVGKVETLQSGSDDEGEEFVDVSARLKNAQRLEQRLLRMVETHVGRVTDLLAVERALAQTREDIERYEGRVRYLRAQAVYGTLTATVHDLPRIVASTSEASFLMDALAQAWRNFLFLVAFAIQVSGVVVPLALLALVAWGVRARLGWTGGAAPFALSLRRPR